MHPLVLDWHRIIRRQEMTDEKREPIGGYDLEDVDRVGDAKIVI